MTFHMQDTRQHTISDEALRSSLLIALDKNRGSSYKLLIFLFKVNCLSGFAVLHKKMQTWYWNVNMFSVSDLLW